ncbi:ACR3 family arsenite efflux transporter [Methanohalophilus halophilus]|uniref:ACR3 family arsenite efflux transporter n=1 Tax=Methanohalophilus halophilus TaxID=2177 RepID=A0A1L3Q317_9EURY|nr:ACR3 family arsenite efflux transporter [Methanohalophilus halophilus]APH39274.1 arsenical-resistance protein [Methanohalophilus halophilus]RNI09661.1 ACR3 family arsenite efflux transporter [Methanohalophilus halophilus]SDW51671.1 arsenite transporter, ACR3 family [Methanohalophilus halophilus]
MEEERELDFFSKYLSIWVAICIILGTTVGYLFPKFADTIGQYEIANVSIPIAIVLLVMMYPIMLKISFEEILKVKENKKPLYLTVFVNWAIKPFTMTVIAWIFISIFFSGLIPLDLQAEYIAGLIILGLAPCTAMVLVWTYLANGNINYALVQVSVNDLIILILFAPLGAFLVGQTTDFPIPVLTIFYSVLFYVALPLVLAMLTRHYVIKRKGLSWFENNLIDKIEWITPAGLLVTLILIFTLQGEMIIKYPFHIVLIAIPIIVQTYFIFAISYYGAKKLKIPFYEAAPSAFIAPSNFFELAVATTLILFGATSGATLATVVGVLVEVPVMLSLVKIMKMNRHKFQFEEGM